MTTKVIIAEKADAARRIAYFLSGGESKQRSAKGLSYIEFDEDGQKNYLIPLSGHIVETNFPSSMKDWKSVNLNKLIDANIELNVKNKRAHNTLKSIGIEADSIIIATDYDREGELIGVEALNVILDDFKKAKKGNPDIKRAKFSALTGQEIKDAFANLIEIDYNLADSAQAREEIDLIWGAVLTRFFSLAAKRYGKNFLSVGRVQTPTLAIIVRREMEIKNFKPEHFWKIEIVFNKKGDFTGEYEGGNIFEKDEAQKVYDAINGKNGIVKSFERRKERIFKPPPFNTTEFLREASRIGVPPSKAMSIAESLYMKGLISYPRTDNTVYQKSIAFKPILNRLMESDFSKDVEMVLSQEKIIPSRGKREAMDHPPIYPVNPAKKGSLKGDYGKIYELVVRRFLATLYIEGEREVSEAVIGVAGHNFNTRGVVVTKKGWLDLYPYRTVKESYHPELEEGEEVRAKDWLMTEDETKPPNRYDLSSLIKKMEDLSLGTKSTRHDIIGKLQSRGFIEGNPVRPTHLGIGLIESILTIDSKIAEAEMTAELEEDMDKITKSDISRVEVVSTSRKMLHSVLEGFREKEGVIQETIQKALRTGDPIGKCPLHDDSNVIIIKGRDFSTIKCEKEECKINFNISSRGLIQLMESACPVCELPQIKVIRRGQSPEIRCVDPKCKFNTEKDNFGECPSDGGSLVLRQSRYGKRFLGCSNYPSCTVTYPLPQMGYVNATGEKCEHCGAPLIISTRNRRKWKFCPKMDCAYNKKGKEESKKEEKPKKKAAPKKKTGGRKPGKKSSA